VKKKNISEGWYNTFSLAPNQH